jgi:hypothetical protein
MDYKDWFRDVIRTNLGMRSGATRHALLVGKYAIKIPIMNSGWEMFLCGILGNVQELKFHDCDPVFCPIVFSLPLGFLNVMLRVKELTEEEFDNLVTDEFLGQHSVVIPCEIKRSSFGWLDGQIVAIDYGS